MSGLEFGIGDWLKLLTHLKQWLGNLLRAGDERKRESVDALRSVVRAVRETQIYLRQQREGVEQSFAIERDLALHWTDLSFRLDDIGLDKLALRCRTIGQFWADPTHFGEQFGSATAGRLQGIEQLALRAIEEIE